jgi:hypothetical protein
VRGDVDEDHVIASSVAGGAEIVVWREKLAEASGALVTVRIEEEAQAAPAEAFTTDDPAFGIWRDREDMADVAAYVRKIRQPRYNRHGSHNEP